MVLAIVFPSATTLRRQSSIPGAAEKWSWKLFPSAAKESLQLNLKVIGVIAAKNRNPMIPVASKSLQKVRMGSTPATSPRVTSREYGEYGLYASRYELSPCADKIL